MTLNNFLQNYTLLANPPDFLNVSFLIQRFKSRYGFRTVRNDVNTNELSFIAQNVIDINFDFLKNLFSIAPNPWETWEEKSNENRATTGESNSNSTQTSNGKTATQNNVNAFNSTESKPESDSETTAENSSAVEGETHNTVNDISTGTRSGFNFRDNEFLLSHYKSAYDIVINLISNEILNLYVSPNEIYIGGENDE